MCDLDPCWQFRSILVTGEPCGACGIALPFRAGVQSWDSDKQLQSRKENCNSSLALRLRGAD